MNSVVEDLEAALAQIAIIAADLNRQDRCVEARSLPGLLAAHPLA